MTLKQRRGWKIMVVVKDLIKTENRDTSHSKPCKDESSVE
jgi:hypothetical protein